MGNVVIKDTPYTPQEAGYEAERLEVLNRHFREMIDKKELVSGSYCLTHEGKVFADNALGSFSFEEDDTREFEPDTIFSIASITKLFTSIAILKLVEDGQIRLDQPVGEILEEFNTPPYNEIFDDYIPSTGGGLYSTCRDLTKFGNMILNYGNYNGKRVIGRKAIEAMRRIHTKPDVQDFCWGAQGNYHSYGLGPDIFNSNNESMLITPGIISHEGFGTCCLMIDFEEKFVAVWASQFYDQQWHIHALRNVASIIWSGII